LRVCQAREPVFVQALVAAPLSSADRIRIAQATRPTTRIAVISQP
jgi:hypothetical protein